MADNRRPPTSGSAIPAALDYDDDIRLLESLGSGDSVGDVLRRYPEKTYLDVIRAAAHALNGRRSAGPQDLFEDLRQWRLETARAEALPAFCVFWDRTLDAIVSSRPGTLDQLLTCFGVGRAKAEKYGAEVLEIVRRAGSTKPLSADARTTLELLAAGHDLWQIEAETGRTKKQIMDDLREAVTVLNANRHDVLLTKPVRQLGGRSGAANTGQKAGSSRPDPPDGGRPWDHRPQQPADSDLHKIIGPIQNYDDDT